jgi:hypothetical protein
MNEEELNSWKDAEQKMEDNTIDFSNINLVDVVLNTGYIEHCVEDRTLLVDLLTETVRKIVKLSDSNDSIILKINKDPLHLLLKNGIEGLHDVDFITITIET